MVLPSTAPAGLEYFNPGVPGGLLAWPVACWPCMAAAAVLWGLRCPFACCTGVYPSLLSLPGSPPAAGAYIVDNGRMLILWLGQAVPPSFYAQVFGVQGPPQDTAGAHVDASAVGWWLWDTWERTSA